MDTEARRFAFCEVGQSFLNSCSDRKGMVVGAHVQTKSPPHRKASGVMPKKNSQARNENEVAAE
jgi:hypothetical protein